MTHWEMDARPGGSWRFTSRETASSRQYDHHGKIVEIVPPRVLAYTWLANFQQRSDTSHAGSLGTHADICRYPCQSDAQWSRQTARRMYRL